MKNKILYIFLGVVIIVVIINIMQDCCGSKPYGSKAIIEVPKQIEVEPTSTISDVTFLIDNSGSMRGYIDFSGNKPNFQSANKSLLSKTGDFMSNCETILNANTTAESNNRKYDLPRMLKSLNDYSAFSGPITEVGKLFEMATAKAKGDSSVCVIVSDLVLSHGSSTLRAKNDKYFNLHNLNDLKTSVKNQFRKLRNEEKDILIVKYEGDFNGKYYYNYTENLDRCSYKDSLMERRPFYFVAIGATESLKTLCNSGCIPSGYTQIFTSLHLEKDDMIDAMYVVSQPAEQPQWILGNLDQKKEEEAQTRPYSLAMSKNIKNATSKFTFTFAPLNIPIYVDKVIEPKYDSSVLQLVSNITNLSSFDIETRPYNELPKKVTTSITFVSKRCVDYTQSSTKDDIKASLRDMEGKTWGIEAIIEALYEAYDIQQDAANIVATTEFTILKQ